MTLSVEWHASEKIAAWVARRVPAYKERGAGGFGPHYAIGLIDKSRPIAGLVFHNYVPEDGVCELTVASTTPLWFSPTAFRAVDQYTAKNGVDKLLLWVTDRRLARACKRAVGAKLYPVPELDRILCVITRDGWRASFMGGP